jgi:hypothetical protein
MLWLVYLTYTYTYGTRVVKGEKSTTGAPDFDFRKLIQLCEEINKAYKDGCYFATAMRGLLDHVPHVFGFKIFSEVANNYAGGGKSFKETMHHLENASRKVADAHLHMPIRKSETLPTAQQVNCGQQLDVLLSEIVRIASPRNGLRVAQVGSGKEGSYRLWVLVEASCHGFIDSQNDFYAGRLTKLHDPVYLGNKKGHDVLFSLRLYLWNADQHLYVRR